MKRWLENESYGILAFYFYLLSHIEIVKSMTSVQFAEIKGKE